MIGCYYTTILMLTINTAVLVNADYTFSMQIWSYSNPGERLANGTCCICCEDQAVLQCPDPCNTSISFCLRDIDHPIDDTSTCSISEIITTNTEPQVLNTTIISGPWQGSIQLYISVINDIRSTLESPPADRVIAALIDLILLDELNVSSPGEATTERTFVGLFGRINLQIGFGVICADGFYGSDCALFCEARNDSQGHYTCNETDGSRICIQGYQNVQTNCTELVNECIPREGCSVVGGFCNQSGECICRDGFVGDNCIIVTSASLASVSTVGNQLDTSAIPMLSSMIIPATSFRESTARLTATSSMLPEPSPDVTSSPENTVISSDVGKTTVTPRVPNSQPTLLQNNSQVVIIGVASSIGILLVISAIIFVITLTTKCIRGRKESKTPLANNTISNANAEEVPDGNQPQNNNRGDAHENSLETNVEALQNPTYGTFRDSGLYTQENEEITILPNPNASDEIEKKTDPEDMLGVEADFQSVMAIFDTFATETNTWLSKEHSVSHTDLSLNSESMEMEETGTATNANDQSRSFIYADEVEYTGPANLI